MGAGLKTEFSTFEASTLTGIPHRTVTYWSVSGLYKASIREATGTGNPPRVYSFVDLIELAAIRELREKGVSLQTLRKVQKLDWSHTPFSLLATDGDDVYMTDDAGLVSLVLQLGQGVVAVNLKRIEEDITEKALSFA